MWFLEFKTLFRQKWFPVKLTETLQKCSAEWIEQNFHDKKLQGDHDLEFCKIWKLKVDAFTCAICGFVENTRNCFCVYMPHTGSVNSPGNNLP